MKIAITGAEGQLGYALGVHFGEQTKGWPRSQVDLREYKSVRHAVTADAPDVIINCGAYTSVDQAEIEPDECLAVNASAVANLADACMRRDVTLVQISTDYIFGGDRFREIPFKEDDVPCPQSVYARSKLIGELHAEKCPRHFIIRTCGLYGPTAPKSFVEKILDRGENGQKLKVVGDQECTPTYIPDVVVAIDFLMRSELYGTYHVVNTGSTTWFEFAQAVAAITQASWRPSSIYSEELGLPAQRPGYSVLDCAKYQKLGGPQLRHWRTALTEYLLRRQSKFRSHELGRS